MKQSTGKRLTESARVALQALCKAVDGVVQNRKAKGREMSVWKNGQVERVVPTDDRMVRETRSDYSVGRQKGRNA